MKKILVGGLLAFSSMVMAGNKSEALKSFYQNLNKDSLQLVDEFYHPDVEFADPVVSFKGSQKIKAYYKDMYQNVKFIKFDFTDMIENENTLVAVWTMTLETDKLNGGKSFTVKGNSVVRFDSNGKAVYHRDYFDMGEFIYERVPVLGSIIRMVKERMAPKE